MNCNRALNYRGRWWTWVTLWATVKQCSGDWSAEADGEPPLQRTAWVSFSNTSYARFLTVRQLAAFSALVRVCKVGTWFALGPSQMFPHVTAEWLWLWLSAQAEEAEKSKKKGAGRGACLFVEFEARLRFVVRARRILRTSQCLCLILSVWKEGDEVSLWFGCLDEQWRHLAEKYQTSHYKKRESRVHRVSTSPVS